MAEKIHSGDLIASAEDAGVRLDQFLTSRLADVSRARVQQLISENKVLVDGRQGKPSLRLRGGERIAVQDNVQPRPLRAIPENLPLEMVYEDDDMAVINKPAGMMVHAGAGPTDDSRNRGTLVNALLHHFESLSGVGGELRPGIVHRLDKETSGLIVVAKNDEAHRRLSSQFAERRAKKTYTALVHGWLKQDRGTIKKKIRRDPIRRTRMKADDGRGREAITHYCVRRRLDTPFGKFTLLEVKIDTGRTHQIRVHLASLGHAVVGDTLYGAARKILLTRRLLGSRMRASRHSEAVSLSRNFLHATALELAHPRTGADLSFSRPLPADLEQFLSSLERN